MDNLLINKRPDLIKEWNIELNKNININNISFSSHTKIYWTCHKNHTYLASINNKTRKKNGGSKCPICKIDESRVHDKNIINNVKNNYEPTLNTTLIGDKNEEFINNLLLKTHKFKNVEIIGNNGSNSDIIITNIDNTNNYVQVKTLTKNTFKEETYYFTNDHVYPETMLIIMTNSEHTHFALDFAGNIKVKRLSLVYNYQKSKYKNIMFKDINIFVSTLLELIPKSCNFDSISDSNNKELISLLRLKQFCLNNNIEYKRNVTNGNTIDCYINNLRCQHKFVSKNETSQLTYNISSTKSCGRLNGKKITRNYEENDFDIMIVEVGGINDYPNKYEGNFCIISKNVLIEQQILKTETCIGKKGFCISPPDYIKNHWSKKYWNNISLFLV